MTTPAPLESRIVTPRLVNAPHIHTLLYKCVHCDGFGYKLPTILGYSINDIKWDPLYMPPTFNVLSIMCGKGRDGSLTTSVNVYYY